LSEKTQPNNKTKSFIDAYFKLPQETYEFFVRSTDVCMKMYDTWNKTSNLISKEKVEQKQLADTWSKNLEAIYKDVFETLFRPMNLTACRPFTEAFTIFPDLFNITKINEMFTTSYPWLKPYERLMACCQKDIPELFSKVVDSYNNFFVSWREYNSTLQKAWSGASEKLSKAFIEKTKDTENETDKPADFWEFYNLWLETYQKTYTDLLNSPDIVAIQSRLSSSVMDIIKNYRALQESIINNFPAFPLPTKSDMDEAYKRIHILKREVDELKKILKKQNSLQINK
jgi:hypothetical protein